MALGIGTINPWGRDTVPVERQEATTPEGKEESETLSSEEDQDPPTGPLGYFRRLSPKAAGPVLDYSEDEGEKSALLDIAGFSRDTLFKVPTLLCLTQVRQVVEGGEKDRSGSKSEDV